VLEMLTSKCWEMLISCNIFNLDKRWWVSEQRPADRVEINSASRSSYYYFVD
jgi:uncharacterized protein YraI